MNTQAVLFDLGGVLVELGGVDYFGQLIGERDEAEIWRRWLTSHWVRSFERGRCTRKEFARGMVKENTLDITPETFLEVFESCLDPLPSYFTELMDYLAHRPIY